MEATLVINLSADRSDLFCRLDYTGSCVRDGSRLWINSRTNRRTSRKLKQRSFLSVRGLVLYSKKITGKRAKPAGTTYLTADQRLLWGEIAVNWKCWKLANVHCSIPRTTLSVESLSLLGGLHWKCPLFNSIYRDCHLYISEYMKGLHLNCGERYEDMI